VHRGIRKLTTTVALSASAILCATPQADAGRSYEAQIGGFIGGVLRALITGEFAGRRPSQADIVPNRPACRPNDYDDLRTAKNDTVAFDALNQRCQLVQVIVDKTYVHAIAHLPTGYCETLKSVFETEFAKHIYQAPSNAGPEIIIEYKGSRSVTSGNREMARAARVETICQDDGALRVSTPRKPSSG